LRFKSTPSSPLARVLTAALAFAAATAGTLGFWDAVFHRVPFALYFAAVAVAALRAGWIAGIAVGVAGVVTIAAHQGFAAGLLVPSVVLLGVSGIISLLAATRERALAALGESEWQYRLMVENVRDHAVFMTDLDGRVTKWNAGAARLLGWREAEIVGQPASGIFTPEDRAAGAPQAEIEQARQAGHAADDRWHQRKDGSRFFASGMMMRVDDEAGRHVGYTKVLRDMTERLRADEAVAAARAQAVAVAESERNRLVEVFNRSPSFMAVLRGPQHVYELTNDRHYELVGQRDVRGRSVREALPELEGQGILELLDKVYATGEPFVGTGVTVALQRRPGEPPEPRLMDFVYQATRDPDGSVSGIFVHGVDLTERARAEQALRASEARYAASVRAALDCIVSMDHEGRVTEWNPAAEQTFGYRRDEALGRELAALIIPAAYRDAHRHGLARYLATGEGPVVGTRFVIAAVRQDGTEFPIELAVTRLPSQGPPAFTGYLRDITEAKRVERELADARRELEARVEQRTVELAEANATLRTEREFLSAVLEHAIDGIVACDADGTLRLFNRATREFHGLPEQPLAPDRWAEHYDLYAADGKTRLAKEQVPLFRALTEGVVRDVEMVIAAKGQPPRVLTASGRAISGPDGAKLGAVVVMHDLSTRKLAEAQRERAIREEAARREAEASAQRLRESEERLRLAVAIAQMGTFEIDLRTDAVAVNDAGRDIYGWAADDEPLTFVKVQSHFHPDDRDEVLRRVGDALRPDGPGEFEVEQRIVRTDGTTRWIRVRGRAVFETVAGARRSVRCLGTYLDITDQKEADRRREELLAGERAARIESERALRMKDEFLATLSHELRTPLNAILGWSQILAGGSRDADDLAEGLRTIERNALAQTQIIEDLLDMSRIISGKVRLDVQRVDLAAVVREAVATAKPSAEAKAIRLQAVLDPHAGPVSGDPARLQQVMWNLLTNAVKFTPKGGRVQVLLERVNSHLELSVSDTGEGIAPDFLPHVFDRFRQADASTTRRHGGLGLGLSIVKQLVELHGGSVRVKSAGIGQGTTFTVSLPLTVIQPEPDPAVERRHPRSASTTVPPDACIEIVGVKVLVVDDEADARSLVRRLLEDCQAQVITAGSAAEALNLVRTERPDVLICDIGMPGEDGYALIKRVRALGPAHGGQVPAAALTAYARGEDRVKAILAGFQMHLAKPVEPAELIATVASLAGRTGASR
jgi:PAS domain S-box-containing protein